MFVLFLSFLVLTSANSKNFDTQIDPYRLPDAIVPVNYSIHVTFVTLNKQTNSFSGVTEITIHIVESTRQIKLNAKELDISSVLLLDATNQELHVTNTETDEETEILTINTEEQLRKDDIYKLHFSYQGILNLDKLYGIYRNTYTESNGTSRVKKYLATTQFESTWARRAFPAFDEPAFKARFALTITAPEGYTARSNTPEVKSATSRGYTTTTFEQTPVMSSYLVAFTVSEFTCDEGQIGNVPYKVWSRRELASSRSLALRNGPLLMAELERTFNISYGSTGIGKMDVYAIVNFDAGAMENWGHATFREKTLLYDGSVFSKHRVTTVIAHEFAHMWTGNLVTMEWWSDVFLNEGFARYYQYFATHNVFPEFELDKQFVINQVHGALWVDSYETSLALSSSVSTNMEIRRKFDAISYSKGGSIIRMIVNLLGTELFEKGIQNYFKIFQYKNARAEDLWFTLDQVFNVAPNLRLTTVMANWTVEPGYPYLSVTSAGNDIIINQKRFVLSGQFDTEWYVPISYRTSSKANFSDTTITDWLKPGEPLILYEVFTNEDWIIFNTQQKGFYRVLYDENLLDKIQLVLENSPDIIHLLNRAQVVDDLENFASANITTYSRFLNFIGYLENETEHYPWRAALNGISNMLNNLNNDNLRIKLKGHVMKLLKNVYESVPIGTLKPHDHSYTMKQVLILNWACKLGYKDCTESVNSLFQKFREKNEKPDINLRPVVYCSALRESANPKDFNFLWDELIESNYDSERETILKSLGCSRNIGILKKYLNLIFATDSKIHFGELSTAISSIYAENNDVGLNLLLQYLVANYQTVYNRYGRGKGFHSLIEDLATRFTTSNQYNQWKSLLYKRGISPHVKSMIETTTNKRNVRLKIVDNLSVQLTKFFETSNHL